VKGREVLKDELWRSLSEMVREELGGQYSPVVKGWVIPRPKPEPEPTWTGIPTIDEKLEEIETELELDPKVVEGFRMIAIDALLTSPAKLRQSIDDEYLAGLAETIRDKGVIQPILVRPLGGARFQIVAGEQRYRAAQDAGLKEIPCIVKTLNDLEAFEVSLIENLQRKDLTDYEVAKALKRALDLFPGKYSSQSVLAYKLGKKQPWVSRHLKILELESVVSPGKLRDLTERQARALLAVPEETRKEIMRDAEEEGIPSAREIESKGTLEGGVKCAACGRFKKPSARTYQGKPVCLDCVERIPRNLDPLSTPRKKGRYFCDFCGPRLKYQVHEVPDLGVICNTCGRDVEVGEVEEKPKPPPTKTEKKDEKKFPTNPFPERLRVSVSQAERDVYQGLLEAYHDERLKAMPFLNDDHSYYYIVKATYPDIGFAGVEAPVYLDNEAVHKGREDWDDAVIKALERQGAHPLRFPYKGTLGLGKRKEAVEQIVEKVNALKGGSR
jgi:ParB family chromosome partitioning protein